MTAPLSPAPALTAGRNAPAWVHAVIPAEILRQRSLKWPDFHPEDFCHQCGRRNPCWFADTEVWQAATGSTGDGGGVLCPSCFAELWKTKTGKTAILWRLSIDPRSRDAAPSPAARVDENPYMLADTPEELERVKRIAAERHREEAAQIAARVDDPAAAVDLLDQLAEDTDDIPCRYDHHGACQEHGGGSEELGCLDREAHELLKRLGVRAALDGSR